MVANTTSSATVTSWSWAV